MKLVFVVLLLLPLKELAAQEGALVTFGTQVRIRIKAPTIQGTVPMSRWIEGSIVSLEADTLVLKEGGAATPLAVPISCITDFGVKVSQGWQVVPVSDLVGFYPARLFIPGTHVRLQTTSGPYEGTIIALDNQALTLRPKDQNTQVIIRPTSVERLLVKSRHPRNNAALKGARNGFFAGLGLSVVLVADKASDPYPFTSPWELFVAGGVTFGPAFALVGALIGAASFTEDWQLVPLPFHVATFPRGGGYVAVDFQVGK